MPRENDKTETDPEAPAVRIEHPHDETYTPGYHEGGSRFGFFNGEDNAGAPVGDAKPPAKR